MDPVRVPERKRVVEFWTSADEQYLLEQRLRKTNYRYIAQHLQRTVIACRLHHFQITTLKARQRSAISKQREGRAPTPSPAIPKQTDLHLASGSKCGGSDSAPSPYPLPMPDARLALCSSKTPKPDSTWNLKPPAMTAPFLGVTMTSRGRDTPQSIPSVTCSHCSKSVLDEFYHCIICAHGDFNICETCVDQGLSCHGKDHWLAKRFIPNTEVHPNAAGMLASQPAVPDNKASLDIDLEHLHGIYQELRDEFWGKMADIYSTRVNGVVPFKLESAFFSTMQGCPFVPPKINTQRMSIKFSLA